MQGKFALCAYATCVPIEGSNPLVAECGCLAFNQVVAGVNTHCADHLGPTGWHELGSDPARQFAVLSPQPAAHPDPGVIWRFWIDRHPERGGAAAPLSTVDATVVRFVPGICHQQLNRWGEQRWRACLRLYHPSHPLGGTHAAQIADKMKKECKNKRCISGKLFNKSTICR